MKMHLCAQNMEKKQKGFFEADNEKDRYCDR